MLKKKSKFYALCLLLICLGVSPQVHAYNFEEQNKEYLFQSEDDLVRGFVWGLSPELIKEFEKGTFMEATDDGAMFFLDRILGVKSTIAYRFSQNKLARVSIFNEKFYSDPQGRIDDLLTLQTYLTERYGEPARESFIWKEGLNKNNPEKWGWAVYMADLSVEIIWQTNDANIILDLSAKEAFEPEMTLTFEQSQNNEIGQDLDPKNEFLVPLRTPGISAQ